MTSSLSDLQVNRKRSVSELSNTSSVSNPSSAPNNSSTSSVVPSLLQNLPVVLNRSVSSSPAPYYPGTSSHVYSYSGHPAVFHPQFASPLIIEARDYDEDDHNVEEEEEEEPLPDSYSEARRDRSK